MIRRSSKFAVAPLTLMIATLPSAWAEDAPAAAKVLEQVVVTAPADREVPANAATLEGAGLASKRAATSDTASLLDGVPGVSLQGAGGVSSLPVIHGLADDRVRIKTDGVDAIASCPNHMNPPLSYLDPTNVGSVKVFAGITPVSVGGDSLGGTIVVDTPAPAFAAPGQESLFKGEVGAFYRSNGSGRGANLSATYGTDTLSVTYAGATAKADNYKAAEDFKTFIATGRTGHTLPIDEVGSTAYETRNQSLGVAFKGGNHLIEAKFSVQDIPYQLYPNQRMDLLDNTQQRLNLRYVGQFDWGALEARAYDETVKHYMNFGPDKQLVYGSATGGMPMNTDGKTTGVTVKASIDVTQQDLLRVGGEYQHYALEDWWPPSGAGMMSPATFWNIHDGKRDRAALFGEWEKRLDPQWLTLLGLRYEQVQTDAGLVHGYNQSTYPTVVAGGSNNQIRDAANFNNASRGKTDGNIDLTALARYAVDKTRDIEFGFARKVRSPNLYERYTWSTWSMAAVMNNTVGDGNGYLGDVNLKPEKANTVSATFASHGAESGWEFKATPYYTYVTDYIDAVQWDTTANAARTTLLTNQFTVLKYVNQSARFYGLDLSGRMPLAKSGWGDWGLKGLLNYTNGKNLDTGGGLYNVMPLNVKLTLTQQFGGWDNGIELVGVQAKDKLSAPRNEVRTPGYSLVNLRGSYSWKQTRLDFGIENVFDRLYYLPLGGAYTGQGTTMTMAAVPWGIAVPGPGRSLYAGVNLKF